MGEHQYDRTLKDKQRERSVQSSVFGGGAKRGKMASVGVKKGIRAMTSRNQANAETANASPRSDARGSRLPLVQTGEQATN